MVFMMKSDGFVEEMAVTIRRYRKLAGLSQEALARLAGIGKTSVFDMEKGKPGVRLETLLAVCEVLNISLDVRGPLDGASEMVSKEGGLGDA